jgi:hypothetical protein
MSNENIFRFLAVRPANLKNKQVAAVDKTVLLFPATESKSDFYNSLEQARSEDLSKGEIVAIAKKFRDTSEYIENVGKLDFEAKPLINWMESNRDKQLKDIDLHCDLQTLYGRNLDAIIKSAEFRKSYIALADTILSDSIEREMGRRNDEVMVAFKLMNLLKRASENESLMKSIIELGSFITNSTIVLPNISDLTTVRPDKEEEEEEVKDEDKIDERAKEVDRLKSKLKQLETTHSELSMVVLDEKAIFKPKREAVLSAKITSMERTISELKTLSSVEARLETKEGAPAIERLVKESSANEIAVGRGEFYLSLKAFQGLSEESQNLLKDLKLEPRRINPVKAVGLIEQEMSNISSILESELIPKKLIAFGGVYLDLNKFKQSIGFLDITKPVEELLRQCSYQAGIGDLLMVKQTLKAYELSEFAHVENVLAGESREREHRRLNLREEIGIVETERETEKERDLQSTERNELQNEAEKTVKSQFELEAGLQVSGSYGPAFSFSASLNASYSTTTEETQRKASSYSREVTEKTAERTRERIREEQRRRVLEEIEEINKHKVDNSNATHGHVRGIYRWLNKIYDAQVFNYGQRMMYEFIIPEPAAYFLYALVDNPPKDMELDKPEPPTYKLSPLKPSNLKRTNYHDYVSEYEVTNAPVPPPQFQTVVYFDKQDASEVSNFGRAGKIEVPTGYAAYAAIVQKDFIFNKGSTDYDTRLMIGGQLLDSFSGIMSVFFSSTRVKELSIAYDLMNIRSFALGIDVFCRLTSEGFAKWQHDTYEAIMQAYLQQKADYEEKLAAQAIQQGIQILGRNPLENRMLEREELKKLVIMMLTGSPYIGFNSFYARAEPVMNVQNACKSGSFIRFFENAFEWNNMLNVFYPYFWGRKAKWISALHLNDPDPDFAAFLKAGAARVQVPVRPGFERAVAHFCQYGSIWEGNDIPLRDDDLYVPIVDEITENLGKLDEGVPYPEDSEPWEVTVPTSLVVVQNLEEIPGISDILTGNNINLG